MTLCVAEAIQPSREQPEFANEKASAAPVKHISVKVSRYVLYHFSFPQYRAYACFEPVQEVNIYL
jgi:hypothetical protein